MSEIEDTNDAWWFAQEQDERLRQHQEMRAELKQRQKELEHAQGQRDGTEQVPEKRGY